MSILPLNTGTLTLSGPINVSNINTPIGTHVSHLGTGGLVELPTIEYRNAIPIGSSMNADGFSSGRRKLGMIVYVMDEKKYYQLRPKVSDTEVTYEQWTGATSAQKCVWLDPTKTIFDDDETFADIVGSGDADDAWVEVFNFVSTPTLTINNNTDNYIFASSGTDDTIEGQSGLTWNGTTLSISGDTNTSGESYMASATVTDLTQNRIVVAGVNGALTGYSGLTFNNSSLILTRNLEIQEGALISLGNTPQHRIPVIGNSGYIGSYSGLTFDDITLSTTKNLNVDGEATMASAMVEDLTNNRIVVAGPLGSLLDYSGLTFDNTTLSTTKNLNVDGNATLASVTIENLTNNRIAVAGPMGLTDYSGLTFDNTTLRTTKNVEVGGTLIVTGNTTSNAFFQSSSRTLKTNIEKLEISGLDLLNQVNVVKFNYLNDLENKRIGFIAEDTPIELSTKEQNVMDTNSTIGILMKAVQELSDKVKELESRLK